LTGRVVRFMMFSVSLVTQSIRELYAASLGLYIACGVR
jgi:hypothetical protein